MDVKNQTVPLADCIAHPGNYNRHPQPQIDALRASLVKFGQVRSVVVQDDGDGTFLIIAGHGVCEAARAMGMSELRADVIPASWSYTKALAYLAADNELAKLGDVDYTQLAQLVQEIDSVDASLAALVVGDDTKYDELLRLAELDGENLEKQGPTETPIGSLEAIHERWDAKSGDIWECDEHFVICGDCRQAETWHRVLAAANVAGIDMAFTSPPYAMQRKATYGGIPAQKYVAWWELVQQEVRAHIQGDGSFFVNIKPHVDAGERSLYVMELVLAMRNKWDWLYVDEVVWTKQAFPCRIGKRLANAFEPIYHFATGSDFVFRSKRVGKKSDYIPVHKPIALGGYNFSNTTGNLGFPKRASGRRTGIANPTNVLQIQIGKNERLPHPASFPVGLPAFFIAVYSNPGQAVCDPFSGAGTTVLAAAEAGRIGIGIEMLPEYVSLTLERLKRHGIDPQLVKKAPTHCKST